MPSMTEWTFGKYVYLVFFMYLYIKHDVSDLQLSLKRQPDGRFRDADLANILQAAYVTRLRVCISIYLPFGRPTGRLTLQELSKRVERHISCVCMRSWVSNKIVVGVSVH